MNIGQLIVSLAPTIVGLVENLFHKPKSGPEKSTLALNLVQTAVAASLGLDIKAIGSAEQKLILSINNDIVAYYNNKGWPTSLPFPVTIPAPPIQP